MAANTWLKLLLRMSITRTFGPMFKMLINMMLDLLQFMVLWIVILLTFTCVSCLIFGQLESFQNFIEVLQIFFDASLGAWSDSVFVGKDINGDDLTYLYYFGITFNCIFLLINSVLLLNFVIAILSATFARFEDKQVGLFYEVIVAKFPAMEYDKRYGAVVCAQPPLNIMIFPFQWVTMFPIFEEENLILYNTFLCHLLYFPIGVTVTCVFTIRNIIIMPFAYFGHTLALIQTITNSDETMDELSEKFERFLTILKFIIIGPILLPVSVLINMFNFFINLYKKPRDHKEMDTNKI